MNKSKDNKRDWKTDVPRDVHGQEIKENNLVQVVVPQRHKWLQKGNTLIVERWEDRSFFQEATRWVVFLKTTGAGKQPHLGVVDKNLMVVKENGNER